MRFYIIRHAHPDYENDTLTATGHKEAQALAEHLVGIGIDEIYSSPLGRARLTAKYAADLLALPVTIVNWAQELEGLWIDELNKTFWDLDGSLLRSSQIINALNHWQDVPPLDNPMIQRNMNLVCQGSDDFLARQGFVRKNDIYEVERDNRKKIALFTHMGISLTWLSHLLSIPLPLMWAGFFLPPSSVTTVLFDERVPGFALPRCLGMGDISHLSKAGLEPKPAGIIANYY